MSTRSRIGAIDENGMIHSIYCHFDGYPLGVGNILYNHYNSEEKIFELLSLGDISSLEETIEKTNAYHRDRGEDLHFELSENEKEYLEINSGQEYTYLYKNNKWYIFDNYESKHFKILKFKNEAD